MARRGLMLVLSSPSGAGKTTISRLLLDRESDLILSVSATTRSPRRGEVDGRDYFFVSDARFEEMVAAGEFLEHAEVFDHRYGTPRGPVEMALREGTDVLFDVDWQGAQQLAHNAGADLVRVFILPPSHDELERRLRTRAQDSDEVVRRRMAKAASEMSHWEAYDYIVINRVVEESVAGVQAILAAERLRRKRQLDLPAFVAGLCREG
ncbi:MAG: guanylate kinase [Rhodospirillales bacterium]|jgi:guanylate kinase|nr:guanylate kinase [Rhodospirillales bacterium]